MGTRTGTIGRSSDYLDLTNYQWLGITLDADEYPVKIELNLSQNGPRWAYMDRQGGSVDLWLVSDNTWTNYLQLDSWTFSASPSSQYNVTYDWTHKSWTLSDANGRKFMGKSLYFRGWTNATNFRIYDKATVTVTTNRNVYTVTTGVSPSGSGSMTASKASASAGETITLTAAPATGYAFSSWTTSPSVTVNNNAFTMPASNITVTANFTKATYTVSKAASPAEGGTVTVGKTSATMGESISISASPATGYHFVEWETSPAVTISGGAFTMPASNVSITAKFAKTSYTISKAASPAAGGTVTTSKNSATMGESITLTATPAAGYYFVGWSTSPSVTVSSNTFTMPASNITVTATFAKTSYTITKAANPAAGGTVTTNKTSATIGESVTVSATPAAGYTFTGWTTSPTVTISGGAFTMPASNVSITANFTKTTYTITKAASPAAGGSVTVGKNSATMGESITVSATPNTGYTFTGWTTSPAVTISGNRFTMPASNITITATFSKTAFTITKAANPAAGGTVTTNKNSAAAGDTVTVSQTPNTGYYFTGWTTNPAITISSGSFTMPAGNVSITANYKRRSTASLNRTNMTGGDTVTLTINSESSAYTHKYKLSFGANMETALTSVAAGVGSVNISIPEGWSDYIPNATQKTGGSCIVYTYSGATEIGSYTISDLKYNVPASAVPVIGTVTKSIARTIGGKTYANVGSYYVQGHCGVRVQTSAIGARSSTISSIRLAVAGYSGTSYNKTVSSASLDFTTGLLTIAGTTTITITATDSRGRTATKTETISVSAYNAPGAVLAVRRVDVNGDDDDMGEYAKYTITNKTYSAIGSNTLTVTMKSQNVTQALSSDSGDILPSSRQSFSILQEYTIQLTLADAFETVTVQAMVRSAKFIIFTNAAGNKLGFMKVANQTIPAGKDSTVEFSDTTQIYIGNSTLEDYIRTIVNNM